jgi:hypothetical protein
MLAVSRLCFLARGDVPYDDRVVLCTQQGEAASAELDRERASICPPCIEFPTTSLGGRREGRELQPAKQIGRALDQFANIVSDQSMARAREQLFHRGVDRLDIAVGIDGKDAVPCRVQDRCTSAFAVDQGKRQAAALADDRAEHEAGGSQCQHQKLESPKGGLRMTLNFEPGDQAYLDRQHRPARSD